jgi:acetoin utilization deacetylase AcuC-like enzyme
MSAVSIVLNLELVKVCDSNPVSGDRMRMLLQLLHALGFVRSDPQSRLLPGPLSPSHVEIIEPKRCNLSDLREFHSKEYVAMLEKESREAAIDCSLSVPSVREEFGLADDCSAFPGDSKINKLRYI